MALILGLVGVSLASRVVKQNPLCLSGGLGKTNKRTSVTLPIEWKSQNKLNIENAINFLKPMGLELFTRAF